MRLIESSEMKQIQTAMLQSVSLFCKENGIHYYLAYGSLLGAVRHNGYIPWDDDLDIWMKREDYEFFCKHFNEYNPLYRVINSSNFYDYYMPFSKVIDTRTSLTEHVNNIASIGVYIDVFPMDYVVKDSILFKFQYIFLLCFQYMLRIKNMPERKERSPIKKLIIQIWQFFLLRVRKKTIISMIDRQIKKMSSSADNGIIASMTLLTYGKKEFFRSDCFSDSVEHLFESYKFSVPAKFDEILTGLYGDYHKLPPKDKRITHHYYEAFWKESI